MRRMSAYSTVVTPKTAGYKGRETMNATEKRLKLDIWMTAGHLRAAPSQVLANRARQRDPLAVVRQAVNDILDKFQP